MAESSGDKKHPASEKRRRQAREEGQIVKSQDLTSAGLLMAALAVLWRFGPPACEEMGQIMVETFSDASIKAWSTQDASNWLLQRSKRLGLATVPILVSMFAAGVIVNVLQSGFLLSTKKLLPSFNHVNPLTGVKRIISLQGLMRLAFGIFKVLIITGVAYAAVLHYAPHVMHLAGLSIPQIAKAMFETLIGVCLWIAAALFILAIFEYAFQKWKYEQDLMMTDQELKDEFKESEGDPQLTARRRQLQRQMMMQRADSEVPNADVVVSNPTELAIAIKYDPVTMPAPIVVAKGAGVLAQRIRRVALEHEIPVVERKPLAQVLYKTVEVGQAIPTEQYQAVAEVLRYVYQLQGRELPQATAA